MAETNDTVNTDVWLTNLTKFHVDLLTTCFISLLSPILAFLSLFSDSINADNVRNTVESGVKLVVIGVPSTVIDTANVWLKKAAIGTFAAVYVFVILIVILTLSFAVGFGFVQTLVDHPLSFREGLHFDYTLNHPTAFVAFGGSKDQRPKQLPLSSSKVKEVPVGHTFYVSVFLSLPESDYNREIGVFQLTAEIISHNGEVLEISSHPCMLQFRTWPIRMVRTFVMGVPLLLGIMTESQTLEVPILRHEEDFPRTAGIRIILSPRAGTNFLPQLYEAKILLNSHLRWRKEWIRRWKWTVFVWTSLSIFANLLILVFLFCRPVILPIFSTIFNQSEQDMIVAVSRTVREDKHREKSRVLKSIRRMPRSRSRGKRKATDLEMDESQIAAPAEAEEESSATSMTLIRDGSTATSLMKEESGDSESACSMPTLQ